MTIELFLPGREKPVLVEDKGLFETVDADGNRVLLKANFSTQGFEAYFDYDANGYRTARESGKEIDSGQTFKAGNGLQLDSAVVAMGA